MGKREKMEKSEYTSGLSVDQKHETAVTVVAPLAYDAVVRQNVEEKKQRAVGLFDINENNYMAWCCYSMFCSPCAMYSLGAKLNEKCRFHYILIGILLMVCMELFQYIEMELIYADDLNDVDAEISIINLLTFAIPILGCLMLGLVIRQRQRFFKHHGRHESMGMTLFASVCCQPCSYGQMGTAEVQTV